MNIPFRNVALIGATLALVGSTLVGCSSSSSSSGDQSLEIAYWNYGPAAEANNKSLADAFTAAHPGVKITLTPVAGENWGSYYANVATLIASGKRPDLIRARSRRSQAGHCT